MGVFSNLLAKLKQNTLDKTNLDEKVIDYIARRIPTTPQARQAWQPITRPIRNFNTDKIIDFGSNILPTIRRGTTSLGQELERYEVPKRPAWQTAMMPGQFLADIFVPGMINSYGRSLQTLVEPSRLEGKSWNPFEEGSKAEFALDVTDFLPIGMIAGAGLDIAKRPLQALSKSDEAADLLRTGKKTLNQIDRLSIPELKKRFKTKDVKNTFKTEITDWARKQFGGKFDPEIWEKTFEKIWKRAKGPADFEKKFEAFLANNKLLHGKKDSVKQMLKRIDDKWIFAKELEPLAKEARQYKSAEEFVKGFNLEIKEKPSILFRGKSRSNVQAQQLVEGRHFSDDLRIAEEFADFGAGQKSKLVSAYKLSPNAKIADLDKVKTFLAQKGQLANKETLTKALKDAGYDGAVGTLPGKGKEFIMVNERKLKEILSDKPFTALTKSQLTDIWNKANKSVAQPPHPAEMVEQAVETVKPQVQSVKNIIEKPLQPQSKPLPAEEPVMKAKEIVERLKSAIKGRSMTLAERDSEIKKMFNQFWLKLGKYKDLDKNTLIRIAKGEIDPPDELYKEAAEYIDKVMVFFKDVENIDPRSHYFPDYTPEQLIGTIMDDFPESMITSNIMELHHLNPKISNKIHEGTTLMDVLEHRIKSGLWNIYRNAEIIDDPVRKITKEVEEKIVKHVDKTAEKAGEVIDYVSELNKVEEVKESEKIVSDFAIRVKAPWSGPARTDFDIMNKIGGKLFEAFENLVYFKNNKLKDMNDLIGIAKSNDPLKVGKIINNIAKRLDKLNDFAFNQNAREAIRRFGLENFITYSFNTALKRKYIDDFIQTVGKYEFTSGATKDYINTFLDWEFKELKAQKNLIDQGLDFASQVFSTAHIGGNLKVALVQATEIFRLPADYSPKTTLKAIGKAIKEKRRLLHDYGLELNLNYIDEFLKKNKTVEKNVLKKARNLLFKPLQFMENWKNAAYAAAAEIEGTAKGLKGEELVKYVTKDVYKLAHPADYYNTPVFMKQSALYRALFQYSQFAIKNAFGMIDAAQNKEFRRLATLLSANVLSAGTIGLVAGYPITWIAKGLFPVGLGPIVNTPIELLQTAWNRHKAIAKNEEGSEKYYTQKIKKDLRGNFMPAGSQYNKTSSMIDLLKKGYAETPSGRVKFLAPEDPINKFKGLVFGTSGLPESKAYYDDEGALGSKQSEQFKALLQSDPELAKTYRSNIMQERDDESLVMPTEYTSIERQVPTSIYDIIQKDKVKNDMRTFINRVITGEEKGTEQMSMEQKYQFIFANGGTQADIEDYEMWKMKSADPKDKAKLLMQMPNVDWGKLYRDGIIQFDDIKELQRLGYIADAQTFWDNLKLSDPYYQRQEDIKTIKKLMDIKAETKKKMVKARVTSVNAMLKQMANKKSVKRTPFKVKNPTKITPPKPTPYKFKGFNKLPTYTLPKL